MVQIPETSLDQPDIESTLILILRNAVKALGGSAGLVAIWNEAECRFICTTSYGLEPETLETLNPLLEETAPDLANSRESFNLLSVLRPDLELPESSEGIRQNPIIALSLKIGDRSVGLIYILRPEKSSAFSSLDQPILSAFAEQASIAVQNAQMTALLLEEKKRVESVLENSAEGIMSIDSRNRIVGFNAAMEKLTGYPREEVLGKECFRVLCFSDPEKKNLCSTLCPMRQVIDLNTKPIFERTGMIRTKSGAPVDVAMVYSFVRSSQGQPINAVINVRDISKLREMENFRETILSMLGHELQTPLSIIKGYTSTLSRTDGQWDIETLRQGLQVIEEESDRLSEVMHKLLLAARLSAGAIQLNKEPVRLLSLVQKVVHRLSSFTALHSFVTNIPEDFPTVKVEPQLMEQVLTNLIENAIKYSPSGGKITINGERLGRQVQVTVRDEGLGIPKEDMEHIFEKFHRVEKGQARKIQGTGLGLYICKSIIEVHGGKLTASSQPGKGSEFTFTLPVEG